MSENISPQIRAATEEDLQSLLYMARRFVVESGLPLTFDEVVSAKTLLGASQSEHCILLIEEDDGVLTGGIMGIVERDFCNEKCAYILKMYVEAEFRGLGTSRALIQAFHVEAKRLGASVIFASATAGMGERVEKLFVRLFQRYGYQILGRVLVKEVHRG